jgi:hypothetical protein
MHSTFLAAYFAVSPRKLWNVSGPEKCQGTIMQSAVCAQLQSSRSPHAKPATVEMHNKDSESDRETLLQPAGLMHVTFVLGCMCMQKKLRMLELFNFTFSLHENRETE